MSSNWFLYGPFNFEASAVSGSARTALAYLVEQYQSPTRWSQLHLQSGQAEQPGRADGRRPGLYLILRTEDDIGPFRLNKPPLLGELSSKPTIAGFWVVFGSSYLGEGVVGPPDKEPPYIQGLLDACTEEVWWNNLEVYPRTGGIWKPVALFEWPSEMAFRSTPIAPPGIPLSPDEIADPEAEAKFGLGDWLESIDEDVVREERRIAEQLRSDNPWVDLPPQRSLVMLTQGFLHRKRASHEGSYRMVHPEWLGSMGIAEVQKFDFWMERLFSETAPERTDSERHARGQPLEMPAGHVAFPASGWLTRSLTVWPPSPADIKKGMLSPRDIGSKFIAQFKQASAVTLMVLILLVGLAWTVHLLTKPPLVVTNPPPRVVPEPAMSVCSADHQKFMDEFRCQIQAHAYGLDIYAPVCGDQDTTLPTVHSGLDLQAEYCGLLHRGLDGWKWQPASDDDRASFNFGRFAAAKACFNVLGQPYNYELPKELTGNRVLPNPDLFLTDPDLSIRGLSSLITQLDTSCDEYRDRIESQISGAVFATHIGTTDRGYQDSSSEGQDLRRYLADKATQQTKRTLRDCFYDGMKSGVNDAKSLAELCGFLPAESGAIVEEDRLLLDGGATSQPPNRSDRALRLHNEVYDSFKVWRELYGEGGHFILDERVLSSAIERYDYARFGNPNMPYHGQRFDSLWVCHGDLSQEANASLTTQEVATMWALDIPVPNTYRIEGAGVKTQLSLDAALRAFPSVPGVLDDAASCWEHTAQRLNKYIPVHPLLAEPDPTGWPTDEQQICGQICATRYRVQSRPPAAPNEPPISSWVTPLNDLRMCVTASGPLVSQLFSHTRRIQALNVEGADAEDNFESLRNRLISNVDPQQGFNPYRGSGFDLLRVPWSNLPVREVDRFKGFFKKAVRLSDPSACDGIKLDNELYIPLQQSVGTDPEEVCRSNYSSLDNTSDRLMCQRYNELSPRFETLRAECRIAARLGGGRSLSNQDLEQYINARFVSEYWVNPTLDQVCAFNLVAQGFVRDADEQLLLNGVAPPAWAGDTSLGSRIAGGGYGADTAVGFAYDAADDMSRFGRTRSKKSCSYAATQCYTEMFLGVSGSMDADSYSIKPFDWADEWRRKVRMEIDQLDQRESSRLKQLSPWCALIQPYVSLEPGDIDFPCASGVDVAKTSVAAAIDHLASEFITAQNGAE